MSDTIDDAGPYHGPRTRAGADLAASDPNRGRCPCPCRCEGAAEDGERRRCAACVAEHRVCDDCGELVAPEDGAGPCARCIAEGRMPVCRQFLRCNATLYVHRNGAVNVHVNAPAEALAALEETGHADVRASGFATIVGALVSVFPAEPT